MANIAKNTFVHRRPSDSCGQKLYILGKNIKESFVAVLISIRVSSYKDIIKAQRQGDFREAVVEAGRCWQNSNQ